MNLLQQYTFSYNDTRVHLYMLNASILQRDKILYFPTSHHFPFVSHRGLGGFVGCRESPGSRRHIFLILNKCREYPYGLCEVIKLFIYIKMDE
jgi:hypothetical protein